VIGVNSFQMCMYDNHLCYQEQLMTDSSDGMICLHTLNMHYRFTSARIDIRLALQSWVFHSETHYF